MNLPAPRNAAAVLDAQRAGRLKIDDEVIVSLVGDCDLPGMKVYADPGRRYDWSCLRGQMAMLVVKSTDRQACELFGDVFASSMPYPTLIVLDREVVGSIVDTHTGFKLWPRRRGSEPWQAVFG